MNFIIDTSVVVKWFCTKKENNVEEAKNIYRLMIKGDIFIFAPDLLIHELSNTLLCGKKIPIKETQNRIGEFYQLPIKIIPANFLLSKLSLDIAHRYKTTAYDAIYVALAKQMKCQLITANPKCHGKIKDGSVIDIADFDLQ